MGYSPYMRVQSLSHVQIFCDPVDCSPGFPSGSVVKNMTANAGDSGDVSLISRWEDLLQKEMATHSSVLAWKIPWTGEPGRLQSMGSQRVRHDWATSLECFQYCEYYEFSDCIST